MKWISNNYGGKRGLLWHFLARIACAGQCYRKYCRIDWGRVTRLVFVCKGNICRSAFAVTLAQKRGLPVASFGLCAVDGDLADVHAVSAATYFEIDMRDHRATAINSFTVLPGDLLIVMEPEQAIVLTPHLTAGAQCTLLGLWATPRRPHIEDPYGLSPDYFNVCFQIIYSAVENFSMKLSCEDRNRA